MNRIHPTYSYKTLSPVSAVPSVYLHRSWLLLRGVRLQTDSRCQPAGFAVNIGSHTTEKEHWGGETHTQLRPAFFEAREVHSSATGVANRSVNILRSQLATLAALSRMQSSGKQTYTSPQPRHEFKRPRCRQSPTRLPVEAVHFFLKKTYIYIYMYMYTYICIYLRFSNPSGPVEGLCTTLQRPQQSPRNPVNHPSRLPRF